MVATCGRSNTHGGSITNRNVLGKWLDLFAEFSGLEQRKIRCHEKDGHFSVFSLCLSVRSVVPDLPMSDTVQFGGKTGWCCNLQYLRVDRRKLVRNLPR